MVACGTLREQYNLDNSSKPLTQRIQAQGRMAEPEVVSTCLRTEQEDLPTSWPVALPGPEDRGAHTRPVAGSA